MSGELVRRAVPIRSETNSWRKPASPIRCESVPGSWLSSVADGEESSKEQRRSAFPMEQPFGWSCSGTRRMGLGGRDSRSTVSWNSHEHD